MKKTTALMVVAMVAAGFSNSLFAQTSTTTQQRTMTQQGGMAAQTYVQPGFQQPAPRMGFQGQMIHGYGMKVVSVNWGSAAQRAGLESGDVVLGINGRAIRSQWDYDQALRDAANYSYGQLNLKVRNVRYDWGYNVPMQVHVSTVLDGFGGQVVPASPVGPIGPRSQQHTGHQHTGPAVVAHQHR